MNVFEIVIGFLAAMAIGLWLIWFVVPLWQSGRRWFAVAIAGAYVFIVATPHPFDKGAALVAVVLTIYCLRQNKNTASC